jgi:hypothetical protein
MIGDQIIEGEKEFAFYDTILDKFLEFAGSQVWSSHIEFVDDWKRSNRDQRFNYPFERLNSLIALEKINVIAPTP